MIECISLLQGIPPADLIYLFAAIIILLIAVRFLAYTFSQHLSVREFWKEFRESFWAS